ncbi:MAG TPA: histidine--tRNA ligase [Dysgonamonadaceae bacterium]|nr:histidine--tRNA ligase [Dysgonamonadaceae bacterium]
MHKPSITKGTRDFSPEEMAKRNYIFDTIKNVYKLYGFKQIETPAMENLSTLMGKYGDEGDQLLFKILNSGNFLRSMSTQDITENNAVVTANKISEKGLRYDLTVPLARYVVMHRNEITFPFKRYQIQPVWRADRPQRGRYREFFQCDADIVGSDSLLNEIELIEIIDKVFTQLGIRITTKLNNRKVLSGIAEIIGEADKITDITVAIDKLDKIGLDKVNEELLSKHIPKSAIEKLQPIILLEGSESSKLKVLKSELANSEIGLKGVEELEFILKKLTLLNLKNNVELDLTLARGLEYYTGAIIEVEAMDVEMGSITGGGRYDNLTEFFGLADVSGVGISFGADRIYDVLNQLNLYPEGLSSGVDVMFVNFGEKEESYILPILSQLRSKGISTEIYPDAARMKRQMTYADNNNAKYVAIIGKNEISENKISLRNMKSGEQEMITLEETIDIITENKQ